MASHGAVFAVVRISYGEQQKKNNEIFDARAHPGTMVSL
jgi:hypothetical protein